MSVTFKRLFTVFIAVVMVFTMIPFAGVGITASAAGKVDVSLNLVSETDTQVVLSVAVNPNGVSVGALEVLLYGKTNKTGACTDITCFSDVFNIVTGVAETGRVAAVSADGVTKDCTVAHYTFAKLSSELVIAADFELEVLNCADGNTMTGTEFTVTNNLPEIYLPPEIYTITYNANGGVNAPASQTKTQWTDATLSSGKPTRDGYVFLTWNTRADGKGTNYAPGAVYSEDRALDLYAQWRKKSTDIADFKVSRVSENASEVVVSVEFDPKGMPVGKLEMILSSDSGKIAGCKTITADSQRAFDNSEANINTGKVILQSANGVTKPCAVAVFTFEKVSGYVDRDDFALSISVCKDIYSDNIKTEVNYDLPMPFTWSLSDDGVLTISGECAMPDYSSASPAPWNSDSSKVKSVVINNGITAIGNAAFYGCSNLENVVIPEGVTHIGKNAFRNSGLMTVSLPSSLVSISDNAFNLCPSLCFAGYKATKAQWDKITIGSGNGALSDNLVFVIDAGKCGKSLAWFITQDGELIIIGTGDMDNFASASSVPWNAHKNKIRIVTIRDMVPSIGNYAFNGCSSVVEFNMPASLRMYNSSEVFNGCTQIRKITITKGNSVMCDYGFDPDKNAANTYYKYTPWYASKCPVVVVESGVKNIGSRAFAYTSGLKIIRIADSVKTIGDYAFYKASGIDSITLSSAVTKIGEHAFNSCSALKVFWLSSNVANVGNGALRNCTSLKTIYFDGTEYEWSLLGYNDFTDPKPEIVCLVQHGDSDHIFVLESDIAVTCTTDGKKVYRCRCGETQVEIFEAQGHVFGEWTIIKEPTSTLEGSKIHTCTVCKFKETAVIPALGKVNSVVLNDISLNYKDSLTITPNVNVDKGVDYTVTYESEDTSVATVDENGRVYAADKGETKITCTVTDEYGNTVTDSCDVTVNYSFGQWLLVIFLFGWIWY